MYIIVTIWGPIGVYIYIYIYESYIYIYIYIYIYTLPKQASKLHCPFLERIRGMVASGSFGMRDIKPEDP